MPVSSFSLLIPFHLITIGCFLTTNGERPGDGSVGNVLAGQTGGPGLIFTQYAHRLKPTWRHVRVIPGGRSWR